MNCPMNNPLNTLLLLAVVGLSSLCAATNQPDSLTLEQALEIAERQHPQLGEGVVATRDVGERDPHAERADPLELARERLDHLVRDRAVMVSRLGGG